MSTTNADVDPIPEPYISSEKGDFSTGALAREPSTKHDGLTPPLSPLHLSGEVFERLTHYLFRYPAKFHPPVVRTLLERYSDPGDTVLDPFCGSGTLLVEALTMERSAIGIDIDPVAVAVASAKVHRYAPVRLRNSASIIVRKVKKHERSNDEYEKRMFSDISRREYDQASDRVRSYIPDIPNLAHWFRRYVVIDLAKLLCTINAASIPGSHKTFFRVVFASIIRASSNADPVPVSGLEVTSHMIRQQELGRMINPFALFSKALEKALIATDDFYRLSSSTPHAAARRGDATKLGPLKRRIDSVITSPPYHGAVDYYRRHQLEMFWLGHTTSQQQRLALLDGYVGRPRVPRRDPLLSPAPLNNALAKRWEQNMRDISYARADAFKHYILSMSRVFEGLARLLPAGRPAVFVVGNSTWNSIEIPTSDLFRELAGRAFDLQDILYYPIKNRYMSYSRHNDASIATEYVLAFRRTPTD